MGTLYLVPTPVGNLEDITARALRVLREADLILAEDTRTSGNLLKHFDIKNAMLSYHKFNEHKTVESIRCWHARYQRPGLPRGSRSH